MTKFIFENKDKKAFKDCSDEEMLLIIKSKLEGDGCHRYLGKSLWRITGNDLIYLSGRYRVLAPEPVPNWIDWDQCPIWAKYCVTFPCGKSYISEHSVYDSRFFGGKLVRIDDFPFFKRGTVAPEDSLLVRPE